MVVRCLYNVVLVAACVTVNTCAGHSHNSTSVDDPVSCYSVAAVCTRKEMGDRRTEEEDAFTASKYTSILIPWVLSASAIPCPR